MHKIRMFSFSICQNEVYNWNYLIRRMFLEAEILSYKEWVATADIIIG